MTRKSAARINPQQSSPTTSLQTGIQILCHAPYPAPATWRSWTNAARITTHRFNPGNEPTPNSATGSIDSTPQNHHEREYRARSNQSTLAGKQDQTALLSNRSEIEATAGAVKCSPLPSTHSPPPIPNQSHSKQKGSPGPAPRSEPPISPHVAAAAPETPRINAEPGTTAQPPQKLPVPPTALDLG